MTIQSGRRGRDIGVKRNGAILVATRGHFQKNGCPNKCCRGQTHNFDPRDRRFGEKAWPEFFEEIYHCRLCGIDLVLLSEAAAISFLFLSGPREEFRIGWLASDRTRGPDFQFVG